MKDLQYEAQLANCFKSNVPVCPRGINEEIFNLVEQKKEERREEIRRKIEEAKLQKKYGNQKLEFNYELTDAEKRKKQTLERLQAKLIQKKTIAE